MKIVVDRDLCEANALCMQHAPEVFLVDDSDQLQILVEQPGEELRESVEEAVRRCPRGALSISDD
jgi:ferredoxin